MYKRILVAFSLMSLAACASPYGNYAKLPDNYNVHLADDAAHELTVLYPPASTHVKLSQEAKDAYGTELVKKLRESGYAIEEGGNDGLFAFTAMAAASSGTPAEQHAGAASAAPPAAKAEPSTAPNPAVKSMGYIVDPLGEGLYRVTITVDSQALSRVYKISSNVIAAAGAWTRKE